MSVQLIIYPQSYNGTYTSTATLVPPINYIADSHFNLGLSSVVTATNQPSNTMVYVQAASTALVGRWKGYHTECTLVSGCTRSSTSAPTSSPSALTLTSASTTASGLFSRCGVYQRVSGLTIGTQYDLKINLSTSRDDGWLQARTVETNGSNWVSANFSNALTTTTTDKTFTFWATATTQDILVDYRQQAPLGSGGESIIISSITLTQAGLSPSFVYSNLADGQVICDLYEDETIPLSLSVDDFKNIAEKTQSYSKAFNLPATKRNNKIFTHIFEITKTIVNAYDFNPYIKTKCVLKEDGLVIFEGFLKLIDIDNKEGEISYNVNLYSESVSLMESLKDRKFSDLTNLSELQHDYTYSEIRNSWQGILNYLSPAISGFRTGGTVRYPFAMWGEGYELDASDNPVLERLEDAFRPWINIKYLIDVIFLEAGFTYTSTFFNQTIAGGGNFDFDKLFMDFNWGAANQPEESDITQFTSVYFTHLGPVNEATTTYDVMNLYEGYYGLLPPNYNTTTHVITATTTNEKYTINYIYWVQNTDSVVRDVECRWLSSTAGEIEYSTVITLAPSKRFIYEGTFTQVMNTGDTLQAQFRASANSVVKQVSSPYYTTVFNINNITVTTGTILDSLRGELGQWDFLKGIMTLFNLITLPDKDNENNLLIEPYADVFITDTKSGTTSDLTLKGRGIVRDWTDKIDAADIKLKPLDLVKRTIFKFEEDDDDYAFNQYKQSTNYLYGSTVFPSSSNPSSGFTMLQGEDEIVASPFAATVVRPMEGIATADFIVPQINSRNDDGTFEGFDNAPRILYRNGVKTLATTTYFVPAQNGVAGDAVENEYLQFTHLTEIPTTATTADINFSSKQLIGSVGIPPVDNSYNTYYAPYFNELYDPDTRIMTLKVKLNASDINTFQFFDMVMIKNRVFRVNKIDYKPNDLSVVEFILIP